MSIYSKWAQRQHSTGAMIAATLPAGVLFVILFPWLVAGLAPRIDSRLGLPSLQMGSTNYILGGLLFVVGMFFGFWSILVQVTRGRGTPLPMMPTQELLTSGPFRYCRNPMTFGTITAYLGIGIAAGTIAGIVIVLLFAAFLVVYIKRLEERELAERFGEAYLAYKRDVPFILPRRPRPHQS